MVDIDSELLSELCRKHRVPLKLAQEIISEFATVEGPKKRYIGQVIEEWENVDKETGT